MLFDVKQLLHDYMVVDIKNPHEKDDFNHSPPSHFDAPDFKWERIDNARPLDAMRLTFRGNGIPEDAEKLANSGILEPKLQAFYTALLKPNTTLWKSSQTVHFDVRTHNGKTYQATSTPFISMQPITKGEYVKMKSAALPFLWSAYSKKDIQPDELESPLDNDEAEPASIEALPLLREAEKLMQYEADQSDEFTFENLNTDKASVSGVTLDSDTIESLYFAKILQNTKDPKKSEMCSKRLSLISAVHCKITRIRKRPIDI